VREPGEGDNGFNFYRGAVIRPVVRMDREDRSHRAGEHPKHSPEKTILLVEDEAIVAFTEAKTLRKSGYEVIAASNGKRALEAAQSGKKIDLVLMDIDLGKGLDGTQTAELLLKDFDIPIVFLTNHTEPEIVEKTDKITSYGYVVKDTGETVLLASIKMAFRLHEAHEELMENSKLLQNSEARYRRLFETAQDGIFILDAESGRIMDVNPYLMDLMGYSYRELVGKTLWEISPLSDLAANKKAFLKLQKKMYVRYENLPLLTRNHTQLNVEFISNAYQVNGDRVIQCNVRDISKRKIAEDANLVLLEEKDTLLRELQHRVKNSLSIIAALVNLELDRQAGEATRDVLLKVRNRVQSIGHLYELLYSSKEIREIRLDTYIERLTGSLLSSYSVGKQRIRLELILKEMRIDVKTAISIGLILNELITNALKHAFPGDRCGSIRVALRRQKKEAIIEVADDGKGLPAGFSTGAAKGLGMNLVRLLSDQISGGFENVRGKGTLFRIHFPL
jgi:PAS domain S-box-containing protein